MGIGSNGQLYLPLNGAWSPRLSMDDTWSLRAIRVFQFRTAPLIASGWTLGSTCHVPFIGRGRTQTLVRPWRTQFIFARALSCPTATSSVEPHVLQLSFSPAREASCEQMNWGERGEKRNTTQPPKIGFQNASSNLDWMKWDLNPYRHNYEISQIQKKSCDNINYSLRTW
jgi:hypothetical protein